MSKQNAYSLAIDQGSHSSRAIVFDELGNALASASQAVDVVRTGSDRVEHDAMALLCSVQTVIAEVLDQLPANLRAQISCCGIATQRSSVLAWNSQGEALSSILSWQDTRAAAFMETLRPHQADIQSATGLPLSAHYGASKLNWLLNEAPQVKHCPPERLRLSPMVSYLLFHLLENKPYGVDHSNAQRTQLLDLATLNWSRPLSVWFEVPTHTLPDCVPMAHHYGTLLGSDIPVTAVCGDQNAAMFGLGELGHETALVNLGSGAFILRPIANNFPSDRQLTGIALTTDDSVQYLREATINGAGNAMSWAEAKLQLDGVDGVQQQLPAWLARIQAPPLFINTVGGLGSPWWRQGIQPHWLALDTSDANDKEIKPARMVAVVESILFMIQANLELMRNEGALKQLRVSGGLSQVDAICQKLANLTGLPVARFELAEATARGVAWLAAGRPETWINNGATQCFTPESEAGLHQRYHRYMRELDRILEG